MLKINKASMETIIIGNKLNEKVSCKVLKKNSCAVVKYEKLYETSEKISKKENHNNVPSSTIIHKRSSEKKSLIDLDSDFYKFMDKLR